ncbi:hypothetical protein [Dyadobacter sandarakinus]|uniref:hypothetical protein n=1 Tax=Dyadobacter sandarakinus TaxID=2747268 RepID=UPI001E4483AC|nr:hypothetical protein [Dyadobacter sandarakinus]
MTTGFPLAQTLDSASSACDLVVRRYRQIGREMQFELAANAGGLAPYYVEITQGARQLKFNKVPHRLGLWLTIPDVDLLEGEAQVQVISLGQEGCATKAAFRYDASLKTEIPDTSTWVRQGSKDNLLDVRPVKKDGKLYLRDFAAYQDGRTKVVMIDGIAVNGLENGIEVRPGYLYSVTARWIDAPYNDWWNERRNRTVRQQNIWIKGASDAPSQGPLTKIQIPGWFRLSNNIQVDFDTSFPEFEPIKGKLTMQYRLNAGVAPDSYLRRGVRFLNGSEKGIPESRMHWTATPNYFADKDAAWFASLTREQVESYANVPGFGAYAFDFEFWNQKYPPEVRQRLIWFSEKIRKDHPQMYLMDYWGGGAYVNPHINKNGGTSPLSLAGDYTAPKANNPNFDPLPDGSSFRNIFNATPADVYPKPMFALDEQGNTPNNFVLLSAIHTHRINRLIDYQKGNKLIFYGWNRYMPLYHDPIVPWHIQLSAPAGELVSNQLEMMPASQALSLSLFSLVLFDGYYLWHDSGPYSADNNAYKVGKDQPGWGYEWFPADGKTPESEIGRQHTGHMAPPYWDFPTSYYVLGNWMAKQTEDILTGGQVKDLPFRLNGSWIQPRKEQVLLAIDRKEPFVTSVINGKKIVVLAVDSFQAPNATRRLNIQLPDGTETSIELYGNWPSLYKGKLK